MRKRFVYNSLFSLTYLITGLSIQMNGQSAFQGDINSATYVAKNSFSNEIYLKSKTITPERMESGTDPVSSDPSEFINNGVLRIIQFDKLPDEAGKAKIQSLGIELLEYIPNRSFLAHIPSNLSLKQLADQGISSIVSLLPDHKKDKFLSEMTIPEYATQGSNVKIKLHYYPFTNSETVLNTLASGSYVLESVNNEGNFIEMWCEVSQIDNLASSKYVKFIEIGNAPPTPENSTGRTLHRSNTINTEYSGGLKYDGTGVTIMVQDDGNIGPHIDFRGRLDQSNIGGAGGNHGDHVTGIFMGAGNLDPKGRGMASGAFGIVYGSSNANYNTVPFHYGLDSLRITTKSYGDGCNVPYTSLTRDLDQQTITYPSLVHIFSTGNSGTANCGYGAGPGWGNITGGHKTGKNVISVASLDYEDNRSTFSSKGPAPDGRLKPDIAAKGQDVYSTLGNYTYGNNSGTSMACPGVTGTLAQLYQAYKDLNSGNEPNSALMKAIILNSAEDLGNPGPDFSYGWGRINASRAYDILANHHYMDSSLNTGQTNTHTLNVPSNISRLKVMLYWKDPAASVFASPALVNDLNVTVTDPALQSNLPLVLNPAPNATTLNLPAAPGIDNLNNMEQVVIDNPVSGSYQINVNGFQVPFGPQEYFIIYQFETDSIKLTYPIGGESFVPGETETVRWDAIGNTGVFNLEFSSDGGSTWNTVNSSIPGNQRTYDMLVPPFTSGNAMLRISRGGFTGMSHTGFSIIDIPANLNFNWACVDSFQISWDSVLTADSYEISMLGTKYMDSIGSTANTYFTVKNVGSSNEYWLSVKALNQSQNIRGRRAIAIRKMPGIFQCPVPNDVAVSRLVSPQSAQLPTCQNLDSIDVIVEIENRGTTREGNFPVRVLMNNGLVHTQQFTDTLELYEVRQINFPVYANLNSGSSHSFKAWTDLSTDGKRTNDTAFASISTFPSNSYNVPFVQDFDMFSTCATSTNCAATICNLSAGWLNETNGQNDDIDWRTNSGTTASGGTGPSTDYSGSGNYLYLEASGNPVCSDKTAILISPCIDLGFTQQPTLKFWYHMYGAAMGELRVDILADGIWYEDVMSPITGDQGNIWKEQTIDLSSFSGQTINIRFRGKTGSDFTSDLAIDEISVVDNFVYAIDAAITDLLAPSFTQKEDCLTPDSLEVKVVLQNTGANAVGNLPMRFSINGGTPVTGLYNNVLQSGAIDTFTFASALHLPGAGNYHLRVWQDYGPDLNPGNDTIHSFIDIVPGTLISAPFTENFDAFTNCATTTNCEATVCPLGSGWKNYANLQDDDIDWRVHNGPTTSQNTGPSNDQNLGTAFGKYLYLEVSGGCDNKVAILESPCIDLGSTYQPQLKIWYHMFGADMGELHLDVFLGDSWLNDFVPPITGDQGNSWQQWNVDLTLLAGNIISFRLRGISDVGFMGDMAIDNISISDNFNAAQAGFTFSQPTCSGQNIVFTDNSSGTGLNYSWDFGANASPSTANGAGPHNVTFWNSGLRDVSLIVSNVAGSDTNTQTLLIDTIPDVNFSWNINGDTVSFINQSSNASGYSWDFGDGNTDNSLQPVHVYGASGIYTVTLTVSNGCGVNVISKDITIGTVGLANESFYSFKIFPNPTSGIFTIKGSDIQEKSLRIQVIASNGILVGEEEINIGNNTLDHSISMNNYRSGIYTIRIIGASFIRYHKLSYMPK